MRKHPLGDQHRKLMIGCVEDGERIKVDDNTGVEDVRG